MSWVRVRHRRQVDEPTPPASDVVTEQATDLRLLLAAVIAWAALAITLSWTWPIVGCSSPVWSWPQSWPSWARRRTGEDSADAAAWAAMR